MEFDFNCSDIGKKYFPNGCICGGEVKFTTFRREFGANCDDYLYICEDCGNYTRAHMSDVGGVMQYSPQGILASLELRTLHGYLKSKFNLLWQAPDPKINAVFNPYVLSFEDQYGDIRCGQVEAFDASSRKYSITTETGETFSVNMEDCEHINYRSKAYYYLSKSLGLPLHLAQIPMLSLEDTARAIQIIEEDLRKLNVQLINKEDENSHQQCNNENLA